MVLLAATLMLSCGDDGEQPANGVDFHPAGGVYEKTHRDNPTARLHPFDHAAVIVLEPVGTHDGDTGDAQGVDELRYHFDLPPDVRLTLGDFDDAPVLVVLDADGVEIARLGPDSPDVTISEKGAYTLRFEHPRKGDAEAEPIVIFVHPSSSASSALTIDEDLGAGAGISTLDLEASGTCAGCDLSGIVWDGCPDGQVVVIGRQEFNPDNPFDPINPGFEGASFAGAELRCLVFQPKGGTSGPHRYNMKETRFDDATLFQVAFEHSDHDGGSFANATLDSFVRFDDSRAPGADFSGASFRGPQTMITFRDLKGAIFANTVFDEETTFFATLFDGSDLAAAQFLGAEIVHPETPDGCLYAQGCFSSFGCAEESDDGPLSCTMPTILGREPADAEPYGVVFDGMDLRDISFEGADLRYVTFRNCLFDGFTDFAGATLKNTLFVDTDLSRVNFSFSLDVARIALSGSTSLSASGIGANLSCMAASGTGLCSPKDFAGMDLRHVNMTGVNLMEADLRGAHLDHALLREAMLAGALFDGATLVGTSFRDSDLGGASLRNVTVDETTNMSGTDLIDADFTGADLTRADLSLAFVSDSVATGRLSNAAAQVGVDLSCDRVTGSGLCDLAGTTLFRGRDLRYVQLNGTDLRAADLEGVVFDGAHLIGANLNLANLKGASFVAAQMGVTPGSGAAATSLRGAYMINVDLTDADLRSADLTDAHVYGADSDALFVRAKLDSADLSGALLSGANFTNASLTDATLNRAQLTNARFDGANLTNAKLDNAYLQGADLSTASAINGMNLSNAAVSTTLTSTECMLIPPGTWTYMEQDGAPYTFSFGETRLATNSTVICPDNGFGPCTTADSLCPVANGPFPAIPACTPVRQYCWENCLDPPVFTAIYPNCF